MQRRWCVSIHYRRISKNLLLFFLSSTIVVGCLVSSLSSYSGKSRFNWLEVGSYAKYSFGLGEDKKGRPEVALLGFDDCAVANFVKGNYSWRCIELENDYAKIDVEISLLLNGSVMYSKKEFVEKAENGDLSFIKRIPMEQVAENVQVIPDMVIVDGPIYIHKNLVETVDLNTMELVDENGNPWGKWVMWIDPLKYPLEGEVLETFIMNWLNTTVDLYIHYHSGGIGEAVDTVVGKFTRWYGASRFEPFENEFLLELNIMLQPSIIMTYKYEPRSGILLEQSTRSYLDDILTQKLGIIYTDGTFTLSETNISIEHDSKFDFSSSIPYLVLLGISAIIVAVYLIKKKTRHKK